MQFVKCFFPREGKRNSVRSEPAWGPFLMHLEPQIIGSSIEVADTIRCHLGEVSSGDLVILAGPLLGRVSRFAAADPMNHGSKLFFVLVHACVQNNGGGWATGPSSSWHFATALEAFVPAYHLGSGSVHPAIPSFHEV